MKNIAAALIATLALGAGTVAIASPANAADGPHHARHTGVDGARHAAKEKRG